MDKAPEITEIIVFNGKAYGRKVFVKRIVISPEIKAIAPSLEDYYCGYVQVTAKDYYYKSAEAEYDLPAPGGITFQDQGNVIGLDDDYYLGFDTAHYGMHYTEQEAKQATLKLAKLLTDLKGNPIGGWNKKQIDKVLELSREKQLEENK